MNKSDKPMYLAMRLKTSLEVEPKCLAASFAGPVQLPDGCAGLMFVFKTKKAARAMYGRNVPLMAVRADPQGDEK